MYPSARVSNKDWDPQIIDEGYSLRCCRIVMVGCNTAFYKPSIIGALDYYNNLIDQNVHKKSPMFTASLNLVVFTVCYVVVHKSVVVDPATLSIYQLTVWTQKHVSSWENYSPRTECSARSVLTTVCYQRKVYYRDITLGVPVIEARKFLKDRA